MCKGPGFTAWIEQSYDKKKDGPFADAALAIHTAGLTLEAMPVNLPTVHRLKGVVKDIGPCRYWTLVMMAWRDFLGSAADNDDVDEIDSTFGLLHTKVMGYQPDVLSDPEFSERLKFDCSVC